MDTWKKISILETFAGNCFPSKLLYEKLIDHFHDLEYNATEIQILEDENIPLNIEYGINSYDAVIKYGETSNILLKSTATK